jgi:hypothetical protein
LDYLPNLPHDIAEFGELVLVTIFMTLTLVILTLFGQWWQR